MMFLISFLSLLGTVNTSQASVFRRKLPQSETECINTAPYNDLDEGCETSQPICFLSTGYEPGADAVGDKCGKCINTVDSELFADIGCSPERPLCDAPLGRGGATCLPVSLDPPTCTNTAAYGGVDAGCSREMPICTESQTEMEVGVHATGDLCVVCLKVFAEAHYPSGLLDYGCGSDMPRCMTSEGIDPSTLKSGGKCCTSEGICETGSACPCNRLGSAWNSTVAGINPWLSDDLMCINTPSLPFASLYVTGTPAGMGGGRVEIAEDVSLWVCSDQVKSTRMISEAEGRACYDEVLMAAEAVGLSSCLLY